MVTSRKGIRPFRRWRGIVCQAPKLRKYGNFANRKPAVSPVARKRVFRLRNIGKCSFRERQAGRFSGGEERFSGSETSELQAGRSAGGGKTLFQASKRREMVTSRIGIWQFRRWRGNVFQDPKRRKNIHFAHGNPAVSSEARKRFFKLRNVEKWSLRQLESGRFAGGEESSFILRNVGNMDISITRFLVFLLVL